MPAQRANAKQKTGCCETEPRKQPTAAAVEELAKLAWGIAHPARVRIVHLLASREACVCGEIVDELPLAQSTVSQHLKIQKRYLQVVQWPQELSVLSAPLPFKEALRAHLHTSLERDIPALNPSDVIHRLGSSPGTSGHLKRFVESVQAMDAVRGESFTKTFPEYWTVLQEHLQD